MPLISHQQLLTRSLRAAPCGERVAQILAAALNAVEPGAALRQHLQRDGDLLMIGRQNYDLRQHRRVLLLAFGKAAHPMAITAAEILGQYFSHGLVIPKSTPAARAPIQHPQFMVLPAGHPVPDEHSLGAARKAVELLASTQADDLLICLVSGGGSALLSLPVPGVSLADLQALTRDLLACGASIGEINTLRKHLSQIKGGQLARLAAPAQVATLILSDVVGDPLDVIASGPTVPDQSTFQDANAILKKYALGDQAPTPIRAHLDLGLQGKLPETPKSNDPLFDAVQNLVIGNNRQAALAAQAQAAQTGFHSLLLTTSLQGEASQVGPMLASILCEIDRSEQPLPRPACMIAGGETTVTLTGPQSEGSLGTGGRNQELALSSVLPLAGLRDVFLVTLATDGEDGPTDAAGAVVSGETLALAQRENLAPWDYLDRHDAYHFFQPLGDLLQPGSTSTNVNDLTFLFAY